MATGGRQRKEPGWYELYAKGWVESDSETDNPQIYVKEFILYTNLVL